MECGDNELACHLLDWLSGNGYVIKNVFEYIDVVWSGAGSQVQTVLDQHGEKLVAISSFSFAIWRWWIYRERILHKRLEEYINESDARLQPASLHTMEAILRPGRTALLPQPAYAIELRTVLETQNWRRYFGVFSIERQTEKQIARILDGIRKRAQAALAATQSLQLQQVHAHLISGAIAASRARHAPRGLDGSDHDRNALREFRKVLRFPAHRRSVTAKEGEAFQLLRLREIDNAFQAYIELEGFARDISDPKRRDQIIARSKRFRAQILQAQSDRGSLGALKLLAGTRTGNDKNCALELRQKYAPYNDWDAIEQAEMHYVTAYVAHRYGATQIEQQQLVDAEDSYRKVLDIAPRRLLSFSKADNSLRSEAKAGIDRIVSAKVGYYDSDWLMV